MKKIAIVAQDSPNGMFGTDIRYSAFVNGRLGAEVHLITPDSSLEFVKSMDGILLPGGSDVDPKRYGEKPAYNTSKPNIFLEQFDVSILPKIIGVVPLIGICRGIQTINVALGGTLDQHLWAHPYSNDLKELAHEVVLTETGEVYKVNSYHHQAIKDLARGMQVLAVEKKKKDGIIESFKSDEYKIFAVQWHPERLASDPFAEEHIFDLLGD